MEKNDTINASFETMKTRFVPQHTGGVFYIYQFDIIGWGQRYLSIKDGMLIIAEGLHPSPDVTIRAKVDDYFELINNKVSLPVAFMTGMVEVLGSLDDAERLVCFFPKPKKTVAAEEKTLIEVVS